MNDQTHAYVTQFRKLSKYRHRMVLSVYLVLKEGKMCYIIFMKIKFCRFYERSYTKFGINLIFFCYSKLKVCGMTFHCYSGSCKYEMITHV